MIMLLLTLALTLANFSSAYVHAPSRFMLKPLAAAKDNMKDTSVGSTTPSATKKLTLSAVIQLITMGAGAPMLGEYKETDENGKMFFELEANNYNGELKGKNFQDGWVEESNEAIAKPPGFFANILSGGKLQEEWDQKNRRA